MLFFPSAIVPSSGKDNSVHYQTDDINILYLSIKKEKKVSLNKFVFFLNISQYYTLKVSKRTVEMILTTVCPRSRAVGEAVQGFGMIPGIHLDKR